MTAADTIILTTKVSWQTFIIIVYSIYIHFIYNNISLVNAHTRAPYHHQQLFRRALFKDPYYTICLLSCFLPRLAYPPSTNYYTNAKFYTPYIEIVVQNVSTLNFPNSVHRFQNRYLSMLVSRFVFRINNFWSRIKRSISGMQTLLHSYSQSISFAVLCAIRWIKS